MGARQVKQSNKREHCPLCPTRGFENRMSAVSHFSAHARKGELETRGTMPKEFRIADTALIGKTDSPLYKAWWHRGFPINHVRLSFQEKESFYQQERNSYLVKLAMRQPLPAAAEPAQVA